jgi:hypothetical protein
MACGRTLVSAGVVLIAYAVSAYAEPIRFAFAMTVTGSSGPSENVFGSPVVVGSQLAGSITFDRIPTDIGGNASNFLGEPYGIRVDYGSGLSLQDLSTSAFAGEPHGYEAHTEQAPVPVPGYARAFAEMIFHDPQNTIPVSEEPPHFPTDPAILNAFPDRRFLFGARVSFFHDEPPDPLDVSFAGQITSVSMAELPAPTPEPSTLLLVGSAVVLAILSVGRHHVHISGRRLHGENLRT